MTDGGEGETEDIKKGMQLARLRESCEDSELKAWEYTGPPLMW